jgi:hypothetical protein
MDNPSPEPPPCPGGARSPPGRSARTPGRLSGQPRCAAVADLQPGQAWCTPGWRQHPTATSTAPGGVLHRVRDQVGHHLEPVPSPVTRRTGPALGRQAPAPIFASGRGCAAHGGGRAAPRFTVVTAGTLLVQPGCTRENPPPSRPSGWPVLIRCISSDSRLTTAPCRYNSAKPDRGCGVRNCGGVRRTPGGLDAARPEGGLDLREHPVQRRGQPADLAAGGAGTPGQVSGGDRRRSSTSTRVTCAGWRASRRRRRSRPPARPSENQLTRRLPPCARLDMSGRGQC